MSKILELFFIEEKKKLKLLIGICGLVLWIN